MSMTIAILTGGRSRRMGQDKAALRLGGMTLIERVAEAAMSTGLPTLVVGRETLPAPPASDVTWIQDERPGLGPIGGLATALRQAGGPVLALACDTPLIGGEAILWLQGAAERRALHDGLITLNGAHVEPLFAVYTPSCLALADRRIAEKRLSIHGLIKSGRFDEIELPPEFHGRLLNINAPEDLAKAEEILGNERENPTR